jgi:phosphoribosyl-dephospho-CoA transferase
MELTILPLPHDLVRLRPGHGAVIASDAPSWVRASLARVPWAVVRNDRAADGKLPVGIRGTTRDQRWAATAEPAAIVAIRLPESLRYECGWAASPDMPAVRGLRVARCAPSR